MADLGTDLNDGYDGGNLGGNAGWKWLNTAPRAFGQTDRNQRMADNNEQADHYAGGERVLVAQVPTRGVTTLYPWLGEWVAWASLAWVVVLLGRAGLSRAASRRAASR